MMTHTWMITGACLKPKVEIEVPVQKEQQAQWAPYIRQTVRLLAACASSYVLATVMGLKEEYWAVITAVVVTQPQLDQTLKASKDRILGTLIGAIAGFAVLEAAQHNILNAHRNGPTSAHRN